MANKLQKTCFQSLKELGIDWKTLVKNNKELLIKYTDYMKTKSEYIMVNIDYSQLELYVLASISGDKDFIDLVNSGVDIHGANTEKIYNIDYSLLEKALEEAKNSEDINKIIEAEAALLDFKGKRKSTKSFSFSLSYGASPEKVSMDLRISMAEAKKLIDDFYALYPQLKKWQDETFLGAIRQGYIETPFGRRRATPKIFGRIDAYNALVKEDKKAIKDLKSKKEYWKLREEMKTCKNTPIQSVASDMCSMAAIKVREFFKNSNHDAELFFWVHDAIVFSVHIDEAIEVINKVCSIMENDVKYPGDMVSYRTSLEIGYNYEFMAEIKDRKLLTSELIQKKLDESIELDLNKQFKLVVKSNSFTIDDNYVSNVQESKRDYFNSLVEKLNIPGVYTPEEYIAYQNNISLEEYLEASDILDEEESE